MPVKTTTRVQTTTVSDVTRQQQNGDLITHLQKQDPHLHQALTNMQKQSNQAAMNIRDIVAAIFHLVDSINAAFNSVPNMPKRTHVGLPAVPGTGGTTGGPAASGGSSGNTRPIPPRVAP